MPAIRIRGACRWRRPSRSVRLRTDWKTHGPTNPEMQDDNTPYPRNPALPLTSPGMGPIMLGAPR